MVMEGQNEELKENQKGMKRGTKKGGNETREKKRKEERKGRRKRVRSLGTDITLHFYPFYLARVFFSLPALSSFYFFSSSHRAPSLPLLSLYSLLYHHLLLPSPPSVFSQAKNIKSFDAFSGWEREEVVGCLFTAALPAHLVTGQEGGRHQHPLGAKNNTTGLLRFLLGRDAQGRLPAAYSGKDMQAW